MKRDIQTDAVNYIATHGNFTTAYHAAKTTADIYAVQDELYLSAHFDLVADEIKYRAKEFKQ